MGAGGGDVAAQALRATVRETDIAARIGGDEFALLLSGTGPGPAAMLADKVREALRRSAPAAQALTLSMGVATFIEPPATVSEIIRAADQQMYAAKRAGKDRTVLTVHGPPVPERQNEPA